jgi:hypothetical protein
VKYARDGFGVGNSVEDATTTITDGTVYPGFEDRQIFVEPPDFFVETAFKLLKLF